MKRQQFAAIVLAAAGIGFNMAHGADVSWQNTSGGVFQTGSNWFGGTAPGASDTAVFDLASFSGYTVSFNGAAVTNLLSIGRDRVTFNLNNNNYFLNGTGSVLIGSGAGSLASGTFTGGTLSAASSLRIAHGVDSRGTLTFTGGSVGTFNGSMLVGSGAGSAGTLNLSGGSSLAVNSASVGFSATSSGYLNISGGSTLNVTGLFQVGSSEGEAIATITGSNSMLNAGGVAVGNLPGRHGTLVMNSQTRAESAGSFSVGTAGGVGTFLFNGGTLTSASGTIGLQQGSAGTVIMGGSTALLRWEMSGPFVVGHLGAGTFIMGGPTIAGGGALSTGDVTVGSAEFSTGYMQVGRGTFGNLGTWTGGNLSVGSRGTGTLLLAQGGVATLSGNVNVGFFTGSSGTLRIDGPSAQLAMTGGGTCQIGASGTGNATVINGGSASTGTLMIGTSGGGVGEVLVSGPGSSWTSSSWLRVGSGGIGTLTIEPGASMDAAGALAIGSFGALHLNGGTLAVGSLSTINGLFNFNSGTFALNGSNVLDSAVGLIGPNLTPNKAFTFAGTGTLNRTFALRGGTFSGGALNLGTGGELLLEDSLSSASFSSLTNNGRVRGSGRINATTFTNNSLGEVRVGASEALRLGVSTFVNNGQVNMFGGELELSGVGNLVNGVSGRIHGRGMLRANMFQNSGTMAFSAGVSDIFGSINNSSGGRIIVTGAGVASFYDGINNSAGAEIRVSDASTAVFFGNVTGSGDITGAGLKIFESGTSSVARLDSTGSTRVESGASLTADRIRERELYVAGNVSIRPGGTADSTSRFNSLTIEGGAFPTGRLDINDNALVIEYDGPTPLPTIAAQIANAYAGGAWSGDGITSSLANTTQFGIGYAEASSTPTIPPIFGSVTLPAALVRYTRYGDATLDGVVNLADFNRLAANFGSTNATWSMGDFNYDGIVNLADFNRLAANFGLSASGPEVTPDDWSALAAAVPEPSILGLGAAGVAVSRSRRRRDLLAKAR